jgi:predicted SprT family Zn-dependent metalloprotease
MLFKDVEAKTLELLAEHGLTDWRVIFRGDGLKPLRSYFGQCTRSTKTISYCAYHVRNSTDKHVLDTVYHEVAHALSPSIGHNKEWKKIVKELGGVPKMCGTTMNFKLKWVGRCLICNLKDERSRKPKMLFVGIQSRPAAKCPRLNCVGHIVFRQVKV